MALNNGNVNRMRYPDLSRPGAKTKPTGEKNMANCHDMKVDEVYTCPDCGIELKVIKTCDNSDTPSEKCGCHDEKDGGFSCCGKPLVLKK